MIPFVVVWTEYTAVQQGRVLKLVPCESCSTEYVYTLEREATGAGTSVYLLNEDGARDNAVTAAAEALHSYLANDFDPVPCPACGHYQRYMFPKLYDGGSSWVQAAKLAALALGSLAAVGALYWSVSCLRHPNAHALERVAVTWSALALLALAVFGLTVLERSRERRFDPNTEDQQARVERGRRRAVTRAEFEASQRPPGDPG